MFIFVNRTSKRSFDYSISIDSKTYIYLSENKSLLAPTFGCKFDSIGRKEENELFINSIILYFLFLSSVLY